MTNVYGAVLCAGFGTRLKPLTEVVPKPLLPFLNTPIITFSLNQLAQAGVREVGLNMHHLADSIPPVVDRLAPAFGLKPTYVQEWEILGTAGGIRGIWDGLGNPDGVLIVVNGDSVMDLDLSDLVQRHVASGNEVSLVVRPKAPDQPGKVFLGDNGSLDKIRHHKRPGTGTGEEHDFCGVHLINTGLLERLSLEPGDIITELYGPMVEAGEAVGALVIDGFWAALDNPKLMLDTTQAVLSDPTLFALAPLPPPLAEALFVLRQDEIHDKAQLAGPVFTGLNVSIAEGAKIGPNVCLDGVEIAPGAEIRNAILYGMGRVEGEWVDCIAIAGKVANY